MDGNVALWQSLLEHGGEGNSSCQDTVSLFGITVGMKNERAAGTGSTIVSSDMDKMQMRRKGRRHVMRIWKNVILGASWWTCWGCPRLCTSAGISKMPPGDAHRVHRPEFSPAVSQID